ncbi:TonB-dependent receptor [Flavihumibacter sp. R14]|nr:TonB-dependent receptor [Flavihumibacter soli]
MLRGLVENQEQKPLEGSVISLTRSSDSSIVKFEVSDKSGVFQFNSLKKDSYLLRITCVGYKTQFVGPVNYTSAGPGIDVGRIRLQRDLIDLKEVSIVDKKSFIELKPGKVVLNVSSSILAAGNSAYDIMKTAPGVQMDAEDNIRLNGKTNVLIVINGKQTFMERDAVLDILKSTLSNEIEEIELISNPSSKFDAAGSGAVINIKTKKNKNFGANGSLTGMAGISDNPRDTDPNKRFNSGLNLNFRSRTLNLFGSYNYADVPVSRDISIDRRIDNALQTNINVDYESLSRRLSDVYRLGADLTLVPDHVIGFMVNGSTNDLRINKRNNSDIVNRGVLDSTIRTSSGQNRGLSTQVFNFNYKGRLGKRGGDISFDWDIINYERTSTELLTNEFFDAANNPYRESLLFKNSSPSGYNVQSLRIDYTVALSKKGRLELGVQGSKVKGDSHLDFGRQISADFYPDDRFTNHFLIDEQITAGYANYNFDFRSSSLVLGLRAENTRSEGTSVIRDETNSRSYFNFFPNLQFSQTLDKDNTLLFSLSRRITRPGYDNLTPFVAYLDQYSYRSGNPLINPEFSNIAEITHVYKSKFSSTLRAKLTNDLIQEISEQDDVTHVNTVISRNIDHHYFYGLEFNAPVELLSWWNVNLNLQTMYERYVTSSVTGSFKNISPSLIFSAIQSFNLTGNLSAEINSKYESPTVYGIYSYKAAYNVDAAVSQSLLKNKATLRFRVSDIFNTSANQYSSNYRNLNLHSREKRDSRIAQLSFSYLFGRQTVKGARKRNTGSENEQGRIGS